MEYAMMVTHVGLKPEIDTMLGEKVAQDLTITLSQIVQTTSKGVATFQGGGWHIISHELTRFGNNLIVSFLIRR